MMGGDQGGDREGIEFGGGFSALDLDLEGRGGQKQGRGMSRDSLTLGDFYHTWPWVHWMVVDLFIIGGVVNGDPGLFRIWREQKEIALLHDFCVERERERERGRRRGFATWVSVYGVEAAVSNFGTRLSGGPLSNNSTTTAR